MDSRCRALLSAVAAWLLLGFAQGQTLELAVSRGPVSLPIYVAEAQGFFKQEGVDVRISDCTSGRSCFQSLADGHADLATAAELMVTLASFRGASVAIVATLSSSLHHIKLVARRSAGITRPDDLRGKRIATVAGTSAQYFLDSWLVYNDVDPSAVNVHMQPPDQLVAALEAHQIDAVAIWEPAAAAAVRALGADAVVLPSPRVYTQHFSLIATRQTLARRDADVVKLMQAIQRAQRFIAERPDQARQILTAKYAEGGAANLAEHDFRLSLDQSLIATMDAQARWAIRQGLVPPDAKAGNLLRFVEPSPLLRVAPAAVTLVQ